MSNDHDKATYEQLRDLLLFIDSPASTGIADKNHMTLLMKAGMLYRRPDGHLALTDLGEEAVDRLKAGEDPPALRRAIDRDK